MSRPPAEKSAVVGLVAQTIEQRRCLKVATPDGQLRKAIACLVLRLVPRFSGEMRRHSVMPKGDTPAEEALSYHNRTAGVARPEKTWLRA